MVKRVCFLAQLILFFTVSLCYSQALDRTHVNYVSPLLYGATCDDVTLNAAITAISSTKKTLILTKTDRAKVNCTWTLADDVTTNVNTTVYIPEGVTVSIANTKTVTFGGPVFIDDVESLTGQGDYVFNYPQTKGLLAQDSSGCKPTVPSSSTTLDAFACEAYIVLGDSFHSVVQASNSVGPLNGGDGTYWIGIYYKSDYAPSGWTLEGSTHYIWIKSATTPATPDGAFIFSKVTVSTVITAVEHLGEVGSSGWFDVRIDGVVCDGVTDDTAAIAISILRQVPLQFPSGTCIIDSITLTDNSKFVVRGLGQGKTTLFHKAAASGDMFAMTGSGAEALESFTLRDLTLDGNASNQTDWELNIVGIRVDNGLVENIECKNSKRTCFSIRQINRIFTVHNSWLHDASIHGGVAGQDGFFIHVDRDSSTGSTAFAPFIVINSKFEQTTLPVGAGNSAGGILINPDVGFNQPAIIIGNYFNYLGQEVAGNIIASIECYKDCDNSIVSGNTVLNIFTQGIHWQRSSNVQIVDNRIIGEGDLTGLDRYGIGMSNRVTVTSEAQSIISHNIVTGLTGADIRCIDVFYNNAGTEYDNLIISENQCIGNSGGIRALGPQGSLKILDNIIRGINCTTSSHLCAGIVVANMESPLSVDISGNTIEDTQHLAIAMNDGVARTVDARVQGNHIENTCQGVAATAYTVNIEYIDRLAFKDNVYTTVNCRGFDFDNIPDLQVDQNVLPDGTLVNFGVNAGSTRYESSGNIGFNDQVITWGAADTTPSVARGRFFLTAGTPTITTFDDGFIGKEFWINFATAAVIDCTSATIKCDRGDDGAALQFTGDADDHGHCIMMTATKWYCSFYDD